MNEKTEFQAEMLGNRLKKRYRHLARWARRTGAGAFRLYDRDIPEIPLVLDMYLDEGTARYALAGSLYRRPYEKDPGEEERWLARMEAAVGEALGIPPERIFTRERRRRPGGERPSSGAPGLAGEPERGPRRKEDGAFAVMEGGLRFWVDLSNHLDTGLFPDRRLLRSRVRDMARGRRVLNLFAYTCSFSLYAAAGGARLVDSVDMSKTYLEWGRRNFTLNGLRSGLVSGTPPPRRRESPRGDRPFRAPGGGDSAGDREAAGGGSLPFRFIRADVRSFLAEAALARRRWDLIILDPPTFSNSKKMAGTLDIKRDQGPLLKRCLDLLSPGGMLVFSVNTRGFKLEGEFPAGGEPLDLTEKLRDEDFKERRIPVCYLFTAAPGAAGPGGRWGDCL
jgi:23S rRNA G2069 N7-methylase RlmK/C1962 C5-methylase RlmI